MKTIKLANRVPTLIMLAFLTYASYSVQASLPDAANEGKDVANGLDVMMKDVLRASADEAKSLTNVVFRDPFQASQKPVDAPKPQKADLANDSEADPLAEMVKGLTLDATFLQGQTQIAIINGRSYHRGQHLIAQGDTGRTYSPLFVQNVRMHSVTLMHTPRLTSWAIPINSVIPLPRVTLTEEPLMGDWPKSIPKVSSLFTRNCSTRPWARWGKA